jgi:hypothetical protein
LLEIWPKSKKISLPDKIQAVIIGFNNQQPGAQAGNM